jgi:lysozyme
MEPIGTGSNEEFSMKASQQIQGYMKLKESGDGKPRLRTYLDPAGHPTVGWGHKLVAPYKPDYTLAEVEVFWEKDLEIAEHAINAYVKIPLSQWQFDALVSFVFNDGINALRKTILGLLNAGNIYAAVEVLLKYVHNDHGEVLAGLVVRRIEEAAIFLKVENGYDYNKVQNV